MVFFVPAQFLKTDSKNLNNATASIYSIANSFMRLDKNNKQVGEKNKRCLFSKSTLDSTEINLNEQVM